MKIVPLAVCTQSLHQPFKRQPQKMVKHAQTICRQFADELIVWVCLTKLCGWRLKGKFTVYIKYQVLHYIIKIINGKKNYVLIKTTKLWCYPFLYANLVFVSKRNMLSSVWKQRQLRWHMKKDEKMSSKIWCRKWTNEDTKPFTIYFA